MSPTPDREGRATPVLPEPMLAVVGDLPRDPEAWAFEVKWDGVRAFVHADGGRVRIRTRGGRDVTDAYPEIAGIADALGGHDAVLDGELVAFDDDGLPAFQALQPRTAAHGRRASPDEVEARPVTLLAFDLPSLDGVPLVDLPYVERRERLAALALDGPHWQVPAHHVGDGAGLLAATAARGLEGVVAKRLDSRYRPGRRSDRWRKIKHALRQEFVVGGYTPGRGGRASTLGALQLGVHDAAGTLRYVGGVGTGFADAELRRLRSRLDGLARASSPFRGRRAPAGTRFVRPELVCEARFSAWTTDGSIRHATYEGLRDDKPATDVVREPVPGEHRPPPPEGAMTEDRTIELPDEGDVTLDVDGRELTLSSLDKVYYPESGFTKGGALDHYARIAPVLLPHLRDRPVTLKRYPDGVDGKAFFQKRAASHRPEWVATTPVPSRRGTIDFVLVQDLPTLLWAVNLGAIELHPLLSRADPDAPGGVGPPRSLVFDLDPGAPATIVECCRVGLLVRDLFAELGLECWAKTSGSKGLQVYVPLNGDAGYDRTKPLAHAVARLLEDRHPDLVVSRMAKDLRDGRVLVDWSQNDEHKTTVTVYALRARTRPTVSTPVTWDEVEAAAESDAGADALAFTVDDVHERVREHGDRFAPVLHTTQDPPTLGDGER
ncbi:MAG: DNA ligase D [Solirubrobacteraceae bacterium]|nr:DNA ligase D [Solirubrobacteraceae bacterium]